MLMSLMYSSKMEMMVDDKRRNRDSVPTMASIGTCRNIRSPRTSFPLHNPGSMHPLSFPITPLLLCRTPGDIGYIYSRYVKVSHW